MYKKNNLTGVELSFQQYYLRKIIIENFILLFLIQYYFPFFMFLLLRLSFDFFKHCDSFGSTYSLENFIQFQFYLFVKQSLMKICGFIENCTFTVFNLISLKFSGIKKVKSMISKRSVYFIEMFSSKIAQKFTDMRKTNQRSTKKMSKTPYTPKIFHVVYFP